MPFGDLKRVVNRVRQGDYRIIYCLDNAIRLVEAVRIGHRREIYQ